MNISRRDFLKGTAAMAVAGALGNYSVSALAADESTEEQNAVESLASKVTEIVDTDFVIIGSGMTGTSAALEAADLGMDVVLLEKNYVLGGSSLCAEGLFCPSSKIQDEAGVSEILPSLSELFKQTMEYHHYKANATNIRRYYEHAAENAQWLLDKGVVMNYVQFGDPSTNQTRLEYEGKGSGVFKVLEPLVESSGVHLYRETSGKELIMKDGACCGVYAVAKDGTVIQFNAKSVLLATGGYTGNPEMLSRYGHIANLDFCKDTGIPGRDGDGIKMGLAAGSTECRNMGVVAHFGPILKNDYYPSHLYCATSAAGFRFNEKGERYIDETMDIFNFAFCGNMMQQQKASFSIASQASIDQWAEVSAPFGGGFFMVGLVPLTNLKEMLQKELESDDPQVTFCETLDDVAAAAGVDAETLKANVARYDEMCANGEDLDFMKPAEYLMPVGEGPYYLFRHRIGIFCTDDGLSVNEYAQVLDKDGEVIPGLFAGGTDAGGLMGDTYDISVAPCTTQGWCLYCGRTAAQYVKEHNL